MMMCLAEILNDRQEILEEILNLEQIKEELEKGIKLIPKIEELKKIVMSYFKDEDELCKFVFLHIEAIDENSEEFTLYPEHKKEYERILSKLNEGIVKIIESYFIPYCNFLDILGREKLKDKSIFSFSLIKNKAEEEKIDIEKCLEKLRKKLKEVEKNGK